MIECSECKKVFKNGAGLSGHVQFKHSDILLLAIDKSERWEAQTRIKGFLDSNDGKQVNSYIKAALLRELAMLTH